LVGPLSGGKLLLAAGSRERCGLSHTQAFTGFFIIQKIDNPGVTYLCRRTVRVRTFEDGHFLI